MAASLVKVHGVATSTSASAAATISTTSAVPAGNWLVLIAGVYTGAPSFSTSVGAGGASNLARINQILNTGGCSVAIWAGQQTSGAGSGTFYSMPATTFGDASYLILLEVADAASFVSPNQVNLLSFATGLYAAKNGSATGITDYIDGPSTTIGSGSPSKWITTATVTNPTTATSFSIGGTGPILTFSATNAAVVPPNAPTGLSVVRRAAAPTTSATVNWTDASSNETGFRVEWSLSPTFASGVNSATVGAGVQTYAATGLTSGATYYFRVYAYNASGDSSPTSTVSYSVPNALSGTVAATSGTSGSMTLAPKALTGTVSGSSAATGSMRKIVRLSGTVAATSAVSGSMRKVVQFSGTVAATSGVTGDLTDKATVTFAGQVDATSGISGDVDKVTQFSDSGGSGGGGAATIEDVTFRSADSSWSVEGPPVVAVGDTIFAFLMTDDTQATGLGSTTSDPVSSDDFGQIGGGVPVSAGGDASAFLFRKIATAGDVANGTGVTYTWTGWVGGSEPTGSVTFVRLTDGGDVDFFTSAVTGSGSTTINLPGGTTTEDNVRLIAFFGVDESNAAYDPYWADPPIPGWTSLLGTSSTPSGQGSSNTYVGVATTVQASTGTVATQTASTAVENDAIVGYLVAVKSTATGGGGPSTLGVSGTFGDFTVTVAPKQMAGQVDATSGTSGSMGRIVPFAGTVQATSGTSGDMDVQGKINLSGTVAATSDTTGAVTLVAGLAGQADAVSGTTGQVDNVTVQFSGQVAATSGVAGNFSVQGAIDFAGTVAATSQVSGSMSATHLLGGQVGGTSGTAGAVANLVRSLGGTVAGVSGDFDLVGKVSFAGTVAAQSGSFGGFSRTLALSGLVPVVSGSSGSMGTIVAFVGTIDAVSDAFGGFGGKEKVQFAGQVVAVSDSYGTLGKVVGGFAGIVRATSRTFGNLWIAGVPTSPSPDRTETIGPESRTTYAVDDRLIVVTSENRVVVVPKPERVDDVRPSRVVVVSP